MINLTGMNVVVLRIARIIIIPESEGLAENPVLNTSRNKTLCRLLFAAFNLICAFASDVFLMLVDVFCLTAHFMACSFIL